MVPILKVPIVTEALPLYLLRRKGILKPLASIRKKYSKIQFSVVSGISRKLWKQFQDGELDIVFIKQKKGETIGIASWPEPLSWIDHSKNQNRIIDLVTGQTG